ncbi:hypothetical protein A3J78_02010 [Candidatus Beckwithbacteria bacterium RBG_13_35_6]|uniref:Methionyl/Valyl/Leucyl/Isoleucyl-tRNA synthetase anticodon-binding domain-containing protein n=1 Tax=Candidatus Beckwithbacteria bacterium RBG_13_35_6 TaxID=1797456 RepID=A0A1F5DGG6_9BACT|nr:MAG: hypothetical protein A3J78_02010 [Candidatus Beckwithbacteria bacterium RBG_13_35_6]
MPYGERHYPFENKNDLENSFPADFIVEYTGQVRAWFYVMHVIANALKNSHCFKNVVVTGVMAGTDGRKMSKSYSNYPDPKEILTKFGGDALRLYLLTSPVMSGKNVNMTKGDEIEEQVKKVLLILWNTYRYFLTYVNYHNLDLKQIKNIDIAKNSKKNILDSYIISKLHLFIKDFSDSLEKYRIPNAVKLIQPFVDELSTWYLRNSRNRFVVGDITAFQIMYYILINFSKAAAPAVPFITESIYQNLKPENSKESIHLDDYPDFNNKFIDLKLHTKMEIVQDLVNRGHSLRKQKQIKLRQPLAKLKIKSANWRKKLKIELEDKNELLDLIKDELNVKVVEFLAGKELEVEFDTRITPALQAEGEAREFIRKVQDLRKKNGCSLNELITVYAPLWPEAFEKEIKKKALIKKLIKADQLKISKS